MISKLMFLANKYVNCSKTVLSTGLNSPFIHTRNYSRFISHNQWKYGGYTFGMLEEHFEREEKHQQPWQEIKKSKYYERRYKVQPHPSIKAHRRINNSK